MRWTICRHAGVSRGFAASWVAPTYFFIIIFLLLPLFAACTAPGRRFHQAKAPLSWRLYLLTSTARTARWEGDTQGDRMETKMQDPGKGKPKRNVCPGEAPRWLSWTPRAPPQPRALPRGLRQGNFPVALKPKRRERGCLDPRQLHPILQPPQHLIWHLGRVTEGVNRSLPRSYFRGRLKQFLLCYAVAPITGSKCDSLRRRRRKGDSTMLEMQEERSAHQAAPGSCKPGLWGRGGQSGFCQLWAKVLGTLSQEQF